MSDPVSLSGKVAATPIVSAVMPVIANCQPPASWVGQPWVQQFIGASLAIISGAFAVVIRLRLEKRQEIEYIKITFVDEMQEVVAIVNRMTETHKTASSLPKTYINELADNTKAFDDNRNRLFLIGDSNLRRNISDFYKKLKIEIKNADATVGSLDATQADAKNSALITTFTSLKGEALNLEKQVKDHKFKVFWFLF